MDNMEFNKIFAAVLVAGIAASLTGFISHKLVHPHSLAAYAYPIEGVEDAGSAVGAVEAKPEPVLALIAAADVGKGEQTAKVCATCHTFNKGGAAGIGPNLWGVVNRTKGSQAGFAYSDGLKAKGGDWNYAEINKFLWKPKAFIEGTKMNFVGLKKPEDRAAVIAWLRTLADSPAGLPGNAQIEAEAAELAPAVVEDASAAEEESPAAAH